MKKHKVKMLPVASDDLNGIVTYFLDKLSSPQAAANFLDKFGEVTETLSYQPLAHEVYRAIGSLVFEIRKVPIGNFLVFYAFVNDDIIIHRILYGKRDLSKAFEMWM